MHKYALPMMDANKQLLSNTNHSKYRYNLSNLQLHIRLQPISLGFLRLYHMMDHNIQLMEKEWGFTHQDTDQMKSLLVDTSPVLMIATFVASALHSIFGMLAIKSDVVFWNSKYGIDSLHGLSTNAIVFDTISSVVILIFLIDSEQTNVIVVVFMIAECLLGMWKWNKIHCIKREVKRKKSIKNYVIEEDGEEKYDSDVGNKMVDNMATESLDERATKWLIIGLLPVVIGYAVYSFIYHSHKSVVSYVINVAASCVYGLGFIHLTPQLFINYELKSVACLPWRVLMYRFFNTFVDDLFSFVIDLPLMHRLACFRDDIVFFIFLIQWWYYGSKKRGQEGKAKLKVN